MFLTMVGGHAHVDDVRERVPFRRAHKNVVSVSPVSPGTYHFTSWFVSFSFVDGYFRLTLCRRFAMGLLNTSGVSRFGVVKGSAFRESLRELMGFMLGKAISFVDKQFGLTCLANRSKVTHPNEVFTRT